MPRRLALAALLALTSLSACRPGDDAEQTTARRPTTRRQRDSVIAASGMPGAQGVGSALRAADAANARTAQAEAAGETP
jgi:hypothetical protein